jgi:hypothetical protein
VGYLVEACEKLMIIGADLMGPCCHIARAGRCPSRLVTMNLWEKTALITLGECDTFLEGPENHSEYSFMLLNENFSSDNCFLYGTGYIVAGAGPVFFQVV